MKEIGRKEKCMILLLAVAVVAAVLYSSNCLFGEGSLSWHIRQHEYWTMILELAVLFTAFWLIGWKARSAMGRLAGIAVVMSAFLWIHVVLVPVVAAGLYLWYLCVLGRKIRRVISAGGGSGVSAETLPGVPAEKQANALPQTLSGSPSEMPSGAPAAPLRDFLVGAMAVIVMFCFLSAIGIGGIAFLWAAVLISAGLLAIDAWVHGFFCSFRPKEWLKSRLALSSGSWSPLFSAGAAFVLTMFAVQAGRMNIAVDYDSLWYGVRGAYILDNGHGIYENLGTMGVVYTYSKGFETLTLPLASLPSYSFLISFNLWAAAGALYGAYRLAGRLMGKRLALVLVVCLSSIPGVMNMSITAKTDIFTLFLQIIMTEELLRWREGETKAFFYSLAAFLLSWTMKPTALVFSSAVFGMGAAEYLVCRLFEEVLEKRQSNTRGGGERTACKRAASEKVSGKGTARASRKECVTVTLLGLGSLAGIWGRTIKLTGLPVTSVFSSIFTRLGCSMKYPYSIQHIPNSGRDLEMMEWIRMIGKRLYGILLNPQGPDMDHVILAWGSLYVLFAAVIWILAPLAETRRPAPLAHGRWLAIITLPFLAGNLVSLIFLTQVDGNYFMLLYVLLAVCSLYKISRMKKPGVRKAVLSAMIPVVVFSAAVTTLTNWSWTLGLTPPDLIHRGYCDHRLVARDEMVMNGNGQIWNILEQQPESRVIAVGKHPDVLAFPCSVQSYDDITGSQGNVVLVKTMDHFVDFMRYAGTDYVYVQAGYMEEGMRCFSLTRDLIEYGILTPVCYDHGNVLAAVDTEGTWSEESAARLEEFDRQYQIHGQPEKGYNTEL